MIQNATAGPGAISGAPSSGVSFTSGGQGATGTVANPEEEITNREERLHKGSPVAVLGSGEHVKATGGTNEVGEPMVKDDQGTVGIGASSAEHSAILSNLTRSPWTRFPVSVLCGPRRTGVQARRRPLEHRYRKVHSTFGHQTG